MKKKEPKKPSEYSSPYKELGMNPRPYSPGREFRKDKSVGAAPGVARSFRLTLHGHRGRAGR